MSAPKSREGRCIYGALSLPNLLFVEPARDGPNGYLCPSQPPVQSSCSGAEAGLVAQLTGQTEKKFAEVPHFAWRNGIMASDSRQDEITDAPAEARILVLAGPGTGKTEVVARRILRLLKEGVRPRELLVLSFSRSAVHALVRRIELVSSEGVRVMDDLRHVSIRTFDSWTFRVLRQMGCAPGDLLRQGYERNIGLLVARLREAAGRPLEALSPAPRHIIVDEFQDLSGVRGALVLELLARFSEARGTGAGFTLLGDEAQAIYGFSLDHSEDKQFSEMTVKRLLNEIRKRFSGDLHETSLAQNHRSVAKIAEMTDGLRQILMGDLPDDRKLTAVRNAIASLPVRPTVDVEQLTSLIRSGSTAILTRTNGDAIRVAAQVLGTTAEVAAIKLTLRTTHSGRAIPGWLGATLGQLRDASVTRSKFARIYEHLYGGTDVAQRTGIAVPTCDSAWSTLLRWTGADETSQQVDLVTLRERLDWVDQIPDDQIVGPSGLQVLTVHQSKGREFESVLLLESNEADGDGAAGGLGEEANVAYVALSRPKRDIARMSRDGIYAISQYSFDGGSRQRWTSWKNGWVNIELGLPGDIDPTGFVDVALHGGDAETAAVQALLLHEGENLVGRKVVLCRHEAVAGSKRFVYKIHLQENKNPAQLLGVTRPQVTYDLLHLIGGRGYSLPSRIFNLRVAAVATLTVSGELPPSIPIPWAKSGLWLGVALQGTGDFKPRKRNS